MSVTEVPGLVQQLYAIVSHLESLFEGRKFSLDGHLVGSIGEVLAAHYYDLALLPAGTETHDARTSTGLLVQIKATQNSSVALSSEPQHLLVIRLKRDGSFQEVYNGPGSQPWEHAGKMQKNGQRRISFATLTRLMQSVPQAQRACRAR